jgi:hypothetical protein
MSTTRAEPDAISARASCSSWMRRECAMASSARSLF